MRRFVEDHYIEEDDLLWDPRQGAFIRRPDYLFPLLVGVVIGAFTVLAFVAVWPR